MATTLNHDNSVTVVAYSLAEFAFELTDMGAKGYTASYENDKCPFGGISGSMFQAILVPRHGYYIDKEGNHVNAPNTSQETALKDDSDDASGVGGTDVAETTNTVKTAVKRTTTKKTT